MAKRNVVPLQVETAKPTIEVQNSANEKSRNITELNSKEARKFLLKAESYCSIDLPPYFMFEDLLAKIDKKLNGKELSSFFKAGVKCQDLEDVNYIILNNKNGKYAWRPLQLIHPAIYVSLTHKITEELHWKTILDRFSLFAQNPKIKCLSYPIESLTKQKDKAEQISHWWHEIEQRSIEFALDYEYLIHTDIADCYGAMYTHSIAWALHGKPEAKMKENRNNKNFIGNLIDWKIQEMCNGQTNGLPQGSVLMDFIAEMLLGFADMQLSAKIEESGITDYHILRYRDDYRIFVNNPQDGDAILKLLTEILIDLGLKLNPHKTTSSNQIIKNSIKADKLAWNIQKQKSRSLQKQLLIIHDLAEKFPNSGSLIAALTDYNKRISTLKSIKEGIIPLISIITNIAYNNPKAYPISSAILSKFISLIEGNDQKRAVVSKITKRFGSIPNTGHLQIWLQRITITFDEEYPYNEPLCQLITNGSLQIWNSEWLAASLANIIKPQKIVDKNKLLNLTPVITNSEVEVFMSNIWNS